jgi:DNA topoisomerase IA
MAKTKSKEKALVIVESPAKSKTIRKILGDNYTIEASFGHIRDFPKSILGFDVDKGFDELLAQTGLSTEKLLADLTMLELRGIIEKVDADRYKRI